MDIKSFFHAWCMKQNKIPHFDVRPIRTEQILRFLCDLKVEGYPYVGYGNSTTKKAAQFDAARDFVQYLVRESIINASEVPSDTFKNMRGPVVNSPFFKEIVEPKSLLQMKMELRDMGEAYHTYKEGLSGGLYDTHKDKVTEGQKLGETEDLNVTGHGNWTTENSKRRLHQFMQQNHIKGEYHYSIMESEGFRWFVAELTIYVRELNQFLTGREPGSNKLTASRCCALSLVRQLYHFGIIEEFNGSLKKNKDKENEMTPYEVAISAELEKKVLDVLRELNIEPVAVDTSNESNKGEAVSIVNSTVLGDYISSKPQIGTVIPWAPPSSNWNAWLSCNIDEGPLTTINLDDISKSIEREHRDKWQNDENLREILTQRKTLPVANCKAKIMNMINDNPVCLIRGNTGCGKTTQVGQFILDHFIQAGRGAYCNIIMSQPKRISAVSVADRVAYERCEPLGVSVGYSIRFESLHPRPFGSILFCTAGALLKRLESGLRGISHVIIDEIHERDAITEFILVVLRDMVNTYPDLRIILMSATVDTTLFSNYFSNCPTLEIPGRLFPVTEYFLEDIVELLNFTPKLIAEKPKLSRNTGKSGGDDEADDAAPAEDEEENLNCFVDDNYSEKTKLTLSLLNENDINHELIFDILRHLKTLNIIGSVLIFLPGWYYICSLMRHLRKCPDFGSPDYVILPLHSCLPREDQRRVFQIFPPHVTKVIISTNIAESSVTIDDVVCVIDSCKGNLRTTRNNLNFETTWVTKSNLEQRKGRAGRVRPGYCFHLCSKARYRVLEEHMHPEMLHMPLDELALTIKMLRLGAIGQFLSKALEPPPVDAVIEAEVLLRELKCLDDNDELTPLGRIIGRLPIKPRLGKMLIVGTLFNCANPLSIIAANINAFPDMFLNIQDRRGLTHQKSFSGKRYSDHVACLNAYQVWEESRQIGRDIQFCESKLLSEHVLRTTAEIRHQLLNLLGNSCGFPKETLAEQVFNYYGPDDELDIVIALLCVGLYPNVAYHLSKRKILTTGNKLALIGRRSVNFSNFVQSFPLPFFVYEEKVRTRAVSCKGMTMVTPISLLLFGSQKVDYVNGIIRLDGWINLKMSPSVASAIVALRPALDHLISKVAEEPSQILINSTDRKVIDVIRELCKVNAGRSGMDEIQPCALYFNRYPQYINGRPPDRIYSDGQPDGHRGRGIFQYRRN